MPRWSENPRGTPTWKHLNLHNCLIGDEGSIANAEALGFNAAMTSLD